MPWILKKKKKKKIPNLKIIEKIFYVKFWREKIIRVKRSERKNFQTQKQNGGGKNLRRRKFQRFFTEIFTEKISKPENFKKKILKPDIVVWKILGESLKKNPGTKKNSRKKFLKSRKIEKKFPEPRKKILEPENWREKTVEPEID